jgi:thioester reductase-like protein
MKREAHRARAASQSAMMHEDCRLADGLSVPQGEPEPSPRLALLTGATGFLGPYVVRQLLSHTSMRLVCLVRAPTHELAMARVLESLSAVAMDPQVVAARVSVVCGDLAQPLLGLSAETFECLALAIDRIYHVGAIVNWSKSYEQLRATNVLGCLELLKLAVHRRPKPMLFVSTIAVCFARSMTAPIDEYTDMSEHLDQMPLAYAQSKWVAEGCRSRSCAPR